MVAFRKAGKNQMKMECAGKHETDTNVCMYTTNTEHDVCMYTWTHETRRRAWCMYVCAHVDSQTNTDVCMYVDSRNTTQSTVCTMYMYRCGLTQQTQSMMYACTRGLTEQTHVCMYTCKLMKQDTEHGVCTDVDSHNKHQCMYMYVHI